MKLVIAVEEFDSDKGYLEYYLARELTKLGHKMGISRRNSARTFFMSLIIVAYFGLLNYVHSVLVWLTSMSSRTFFTDFVSHFAGVAGLDLEETRLWLDQ